MRPKGPIQFLTGATAASGLDHLESKLDELVKICLEMDQLSVKLRDLKPGTRDYELILRQIESGGRAVMVKAATLKEIIEAFDGLRATGTWSRRGFEASNAEAGLRTTATDSQDGQARGE